MIQVYILIAAIAASSAGGYKVRSMIQDSRDLAEVDQRELFKEKESKTTKAVIAQLQKVNTNVKIVEKWHTRYIDRPINNISCTDVDGLRVIKGYATNNAREFAGEVSNGVTDP